MIAQLRGKASPLSDNSVLIDVNGVGYEVLASTNSMMDLLDSDYFKVFTYTHVREDTLALFGFSTLLEKQLFLSLIKVNGIGPKMAITVLSATSTETILQFIEDGDVKKLSSLPKIGKKKAEQIVLSLKGKLVIDQPASLTPQFFAREDICSALINLGFKFNDVTKVVDQMDKKIDVQSGIRLGLAQLTQAQM